jgi:hypothetical protein
MRSLELALLALVAVLLMPFGMSAANAAAPDHQQMSAMASPMQHCPEPASSPRSKGVLADCAMACSAALPAGELAMAVSLVHTPPLLETSVLPALSGIELEIATPPPRQA